MNLQVVLEREPMASLTSGAQTAISTF